MTAAELIAELTRRGVRLEPRGERLRFYPRSPLTRGLLDELKAHKSEILNLLKGINSTRTQLVEFGTDGWPVDSIDPDEIGHCPKCGSLEMWQNPAGAWRCRTCRPPFRALCMRGNWGK